MVVSGAGRLSADAAAGQRLGLDHPAAPEPEEPPPTLDIEPPRPSGEDPELPVALTQAAMAEMSRKASERRFQRVLQDLAHAHNEVVAAMMQPGLFAQAPDNATFTQPDVRAAVFDTTEHGLVPPITRFPPSPLDEHGSIHQDTMIQTFSGASDVISIGARSPERHSHRRVTTSTKEDVVFLPGIPRRQEKSTDSENGSDGSVGAMSHRSTHREGYVLRPVWRDSSLHCLPFHVTTKLSLHTLADDELPVLMDENSFSNRLISFPGSTKRMVWDLFGAVLIVYDLITIPLNVFDIPRSSFGIFMEWLTLIFWTLNMPASCMVGYVHEGVTIMVPRQIVQNYMRTWFLVDLAVVVPDWTFTVLAMASGGERAGSSVRLLRILRLTRMMRLLRLLKLRKLLTHINDLIDSEYMNIVINIVKMILSLLAINHFIACMWFFIADSQRGKVDMTWVEANSFQDQAWDYQYATSFHWAITQFTPASMEVQPQNLVERVFAVTIVVFALVGFSYLVGSITGSLTQLRSMQEDASKQFWTLRRFLIQTRIHKNHKDLSLRIQRYVEHEYDQLRETVQQQNVKVLNLLSKQLLSQLNWTLKRDTVQVHPLFLKLKEESEVTMHRLANSTLDRIHLAQNDTLFLAGEVAEDMYIVVEGKLQYIKVSADGKDKKELVDCKEDWIAEPILWTPSWEHLGVLMVVVTCELLTINGDKFCEVIKLNPQAWSYCAVYAKNFMRWLHKKDADELSDIFQGDIIIKEIECFVPEGARRSLDISVSAEMKRSGSKQHSPATSPRRSTSQTSAPKSGDDTEITGFRTRSKTNNNELSPPSPRISGVEAMVRKSSKTLTVPK
mmetsp:Transcript_43700/g.100872  ORF Transcript_43700/g.100872 Transcript_43700/m.100872 type:complete len:842 (+) Transcript_43700:104-2629(+)